MDFGQQITYRLFLSPKEFRLVSKALRGTLSPDEAEEAKLLQIELQLQRAKHAESHMKETQKAVENIEKEREGE
jgi:hypothetical protein